MTCTYFKHCGNQAVAGKTRCESCAATEAEKRAAGKGAAKWGTDDQSKERIDELVELMSGQKFGVGREVTREAFCKKHSITHFQADREITAAWALIKTGLDDATAAALFEAKLTRVMDDALEIAVSAVRVGDDGVYHLDSGTRVQALKLLKDAVMDFAKLRGMLKERVDVKVTAAVEQKSPEEIAAGVLDYVEEHAPEMLAARCPRCRLVLTEGESR